MLSMFHPFLYSEVLRFIMKGSHGKYPKETVSLQSSEFPVIRLQPVKIIPVAPFSQSLASFTIPPVFVNFYGLTIHSPFQDRCFTSYFISLQWNILASDFVLINDRWLIDIVSFFMKLHFLYIKLLMAQRIHRWMNVLTREMQPSLHAIIRK